MKISHVSFLVPAYNDAKTIYTLIDRICDVGKSVAEVFEIQVIDDNSTDEIASILKSMASLDKRIVVTYHKENKGYGQTIKELYRLASYDWMFSVPGDFQIDPFEITRLIPYTNSADMIIGWRKHRHDAWIRRMQSNIYNILLSLLFGLTLRDVNSVRLMNKKLFTSIVLRSNSAFVDAELVLEAKRKGFRITEVPILHKKREGSTGGGGKLQTIIPTVFDMLRYRVQNTYGTHIRKRFLSGEAGSE